VGVGTPVNGVHFLASALLGAAACMALLIQSAQAAAQISAEQQIKASSVEGDSARRAQAHNIPLDNPQAKPATLLRAGIAFAQKGQFAEAVEAFRRCVHEYPSLFEGHYNLALAELAQDHLSEAYAVIDQAPHNSEEESTARIYLRGKIEASMGRSQPAEHDLSAAFAKEPGYENYALDLGLFYLRTHAYPESERVFAKAATLHPRSSYLLLGLALAQFLDGHTSQSAVASKRALAVDPEFSPARLLLGYILYFDGNLAEAREVVHQGLQFPVPDPYLYYLEAAALLKQHGQEKAQILRDLAAAEKGIPNCALCYVTSGKVHAELNDLRSALTDLQQAVKLAPDLSEGWYHLASVYDRLGHPAEAAKARERFQALKANADEREKQMMRAAVLGSLDAQSPRGP